jgi:hypothetical protein
MVRELRERRRRVFPADEIRMAEGEERRDD